MNLPAELFGDEHALKCELAREVLQSSGALRLQVTGWSMFPAVWPGDMLTIERASGDDVSAGDLVLFLRDRRLFVHRVVSKGVSGPAHLITRGDSMSSPDLPVLEADVLGRVSSILRRGKLITPEKGLRFPVRAVASLMRHSDVAARVVVGVHGMLQSSRIES